MRVVTLAASTSSGTPIFKRSSSTDSTGVIGKAHPEAAEEEVERVLFEVTGLSPAGLEESDCRGVTGTTLMGEGRTGVGVVVGCALRMFAAGRRVDGTSPVNCRASVSGEGT